LLSEKWLEMLILLAFLHILWYIKSIIYGRRISQMDAKDAYIEQLENTIKKLQQHNAAEGAIRGFCIGKANCHLIESLDGAKPVQSYTALHKLQKRIT